MKPVKKQENCFWTARFYDRRPNSHSACIFCLDWIFAINNRNSAYFFYFDLPKAMHKVRRENPQTWYSWFSFEMDLLEHIWVVGMRVKSRNSFQDATTAKIRSKNTGKRTFTGLFLACTQSKVGKVKKKKRLQGLSYRCIRSSPRPAHLLFTRLSEQSLITRKDSSFPNLKVYSTGAQLWLVTLLAHCRCIRSATLVFAFLGFRIFGPFCLSRFPYAFLQWCCTSGCCAYSYLYNNNSVCIV